MHKKSKFKSCSVILALSIFLNFTSTIIVQALGDFGFTSSVISKTINSYNVALAPGVVEKSYSFKDNEGKRVEAFVIEVDTKNPKVSIEAATPKDSTVPGLETVRQQANTLISKGEQVVAGVNADFYNMATGEPIGTVIKDGTMVKELPQGWKFFGIKKDGTPVIGDYDIYSQVKGNLEEALGGKSILVKDGKVFETPQTGADREPRTAVGIKKDGKMFFVTVDGRQEPYSAGLSMTNLANLMISMGAVEALNLDGGGSSTHLARVPGTDSLEVKNSPSDMGERSVANSWLIVSKEPITHTFSSAYIEPSEKSFTPNSIINFKAKGRDLAGASANLPESGLQWVLSDNSFGAIDGKTGVFKSNGKQGQFKAQLLYNNKNVGESNVEIAVPNELYFYSKELSMDIKESKALGLQVLFNGRTVKVNKEDITWEIPEGMGTIDENAVITAGDKSISGTIKASIKGTSLNASINVTVGQLPIVLEGFEQGLGAWKVSTAGRGEEGSLSLTDYPKEPARFDAHSLKINYDFTKAQQGTTLGVYAGPGKTVAIPGNPKAIGAWVYATEEAKGYWLRMNIIDGAGKSKTVDFTGQKPGIDWIGWKYVEAEIPSTFISPFSLHSTQTIRMMSLKSGLEGPMTKGALYVDNIRAIYGSKVDDLYPPIVEDINVTDKVYKNNQVNITAKIYDYADDPYKSGINWDRTRIFVDGIDYTKKKGYYSYDKDGSMALTGLKWADGTHKVLIAAQDNFGNEKESTAYFKVDTASTNVDLLPAGEKAILGGELQLEFKAKETADLKSFNLKLAIDKVYPVSSVDFSSGVSDGSWNYDKNTGILEVKGDNSGLKGKEDTIALININIPNSVTKGAVVKYNLLPSSLEYKSSKEDNFVKSFSAKTSEVPVTEAFNIIPEEIMVGKAAVIKVLDLKGNPAEAVNVIVEKADTTKTVLGITSPEGYVKSDELTKEVQKISIYAEKDGLSSFKLQTQTYLPLKEAMPSNIIFTAGEDGKTQKVISWISNPLLSKEKAQAQATLKNEYLEKGENAFKSVDGEYKDHIFKGNSDITKNGIARLNTVKLSQLEPDTEYVVRVGDGEVWSDNLEFKTLKEKDSFKFVVLGDTQSPTMEGLSQLDTILNSLNNDQEKPDFLAHLGDFIDDAAVFQQWDYITSVFEKYKGINSVDTVQVLGNHEYMGDPEAVMAKTYFNNPKNGLKDNLGGVYSVEYNNVHVSVISFTSDKELLQKELQWLREDIKKSTKKFNILLTHQPPFFTNPDGGNALIREMLPPVIDELGIDLVFSGHDHAYGRTKPLKNGKENKAGATYVVAGTTGTKHYQAVNDGSFEVYNDENTAIYTTVEIERDIMKVVVKKTDGTIVDEFTINNESPGVSADLKGGLFNEDISVNLLSEDKGAKIYYTLDGSDPTEESIEYKDTLNIKETTTLKFTAINERGKKSSIIKEEYVIDKVAPKIEITGVEDGGIYKEKVKPQIVIDDETANVFITLNGNEYKGEEITKEGSYQLVVMAKDKASNETIKEVSFTIKKDIVEVPKEDNIPPADNNNTQKEDNKPQVNDNLPKTGYLYDTTLILLIGAVALGIGLAVKRKRAS